MRRFLFAVVALSISHGPAYAAAWHNVGVIDGVTIAVDLDSLKMVGIGLRRAWVRYNYSAPQRGALSTLVLEVFECNDNRVKPLTSTDFRGHEGSGKVGFSDSREGFWAYIVPGSGNAAIARIVCKGA